MGNSSTKLAEKCSLLTKDEVPLVASSFKLVSKNSDRIKEDDLMVIQKIQYNIFPSNCYLFMFSEILGLSDGSPLSSVYNEFPVWCPWIEIICSGVSEICRIICVLCEGICGWKNICFINMFGSFRLWIRRYCLSANQGSECFDWLYWLLLLNDVPYTLRFLYIRSHWIYIYSTPAIMYTMCTI